MSKIEQSTKETTKYALNLVEPQWGEWEDANPSMVSNIFAKTAVERGGYVGKGFVLHEDTDILQAKGL